MMHPAYIERARRELAYYVRWIKPDNIFKDFHVWYYFLLQEFAKGNIRKLIVTIPPQNGKSEGSSRILPSWILGRDPDKRIVIASYAGAFAQQFNRSVQRIMTDQPYLQIFPDARLPRSEEVKAKRTTYIRTSAKFEIINRQGSLKTVGRGGQLTGDPVDVMIMDDLYKDAMEANSPVTREAAWNWYTDVVRNRYHNDTVELMVMTRWHEDDIIGRVMLTEKVNVISCMAEYADCNPDDWVMVNWAAIMESEKTEFDQRNIDEPLWPERHSYEKLKKQYNLDPIRFECMQQGNPESSEGLLYGDLQTYETIPNNIIKKGNYTDTADQGEDYLCSICYDWSKDGKAYVTDVLYTQAAMEETEKLMPMMLARTLTREADIESNNGGRGFARVIQTKAPGTVVRWFNQSMNKESRILTNAANVKQTVLMPLDWQTRWPEFSRHIRTFKRIYAANKFKDAADCLTGIVEKNQGKRRGVRTVN
jgi:predicted phage terminase large subunit-like protein